MSAPAPVELDFDVYGTYARACAIADWLELAAISGMSKSQADLEDIVADNDWTTVKPRAFVVPPEHADDLPPEDWAEAVLAMLREREDVLAARWPFRLLASGRLLYVPQRSPRGNRPRVPSCPRISPYEAVLGIAVAHAWAIPTIDRPEQVLEDTAVRALRAKGLIATSTGTADRDGRGFAATVQHAARELGLRSQTVPSPSKVHAKDAGVDTVANIGWPDRRPAGQWVKIGQVTVARSNDWDKKLGEPLRKADHWRGYFMETLTPDAFLVIPHHIGRDHLREIMAPNGGLVIDRLRLVLDLDETSPAERRIFREVRAAGVERL